MYHYKTLIGLAVAYILFQCLSGYWYCADKFCPGDNQRDYVYQYVNDKGDEVSSHEAEEFLEFKKLETPYEKFMSQQVETSKENRGIKK